jgi:hypothetical protein
LVIEKHFDHAKMTAVQFYRRSGGSLIVVTIADRNRAGSWP